MRNTRTVGRRNAGSVDVGGGVDSVHKGQTGRVNMDSEARGVDARVTLNAAKKRVNWLNSDRLTPFEISSTRRYIGKSRRGSKALSQCRQEK